MTRVKVLVIVTNEAVRHRLLAVWREFLVAQRGARADEVLGAQDRTDSPVDFGRLNVRDDLALYVFVVDGGWRREYVCQALAADCVGYCMVVGPTATDLNLARDLVALLEEGGIAEGAFAVAGGQDPQVMRTVLGVPDGAPIVEVDCDSQSSITELLCALLERLAAVPAA